MENTSFMIQRLHTPAHGSAGVAWPARFRQSVGDQAHLPRVGRGRFRLAGPLQIVVVRVESADQLVEPERRLPDIAKQGASRAAAGNAAAAVDSGVVTLVFGATAVELPGSDFHNRSHHCSPRFTAVAGFEPMSSPPARPLPGDATSSGSADDRFLSRGRAPSVIAARGQRSAATGARCLARVAHASRVGSVGRPTGQPASSASRSQGHCSAIAACSRSVSSSANVTACW